MKEKQEIRRIEIGLVQLVVVVFAAWLPVNYLTLR